MCIRDRAYYGHFREARHLAEQGIDLFAKSNALASQLTLVEAAREAEVGNSAHAQRAAAKALASAPNRDGQLVVALVFARAGDIGAAQNLADAMGRDAPLNTVIQNYCLPTIRAAMKLHENDPAGAVEILRPTVKYDLAYPGSFNSLYPAYIRGLAYLHMGEGRLAAAEFQKLCDHPGIVGREDVYKRQLCASSNLPTFWAIAPVNAPFSWPNNSLSRRPRGIAAQFTLTNV